MAAAFHPHVPVVDDIVEWIGELVRQVDSSLLDEWERLTAPGQPAPAVEIAAPPRPLTANARAFRVLVRNALFRRVELLALRRVPELEEMDAEAGWADAIEAYFAEHADVGTGPEARGPAMFLVEEGPEQWQVQQIVDDPEAHHDWRVVATVDLAASDEAGELVLRDVALVQL